MRIGFLALAAALLVAPAAQAKVTATANVRYETQDGRSKWVKTNVQFMTGEELNEAAGSLSKYKMLKSYAIIFFAPDQAAVIEISSYVICSGEFTVSCMPVVGNIKGKDQGGRQWEICAGTFC